MNRCFDDDIMEPEPGEDRARRVGSGFRDVAGESGEEVLDDPDFPIRVIGWDPEDLGGAFVLMVDAERALLGRIRIRIRVGWGFGFEVGGSFGSSGGEYHPAVPDSVFSNFGVAASCGRTHRCLTLLFYVDHCTLLLLTFLFNFLVSLMYLILLFLFWFSLFSFFSFHKFPEFYSGTKPNILTRLID